MTRLLYQCLAESRQHGQCTGARPWQSPSTRVGRRAFGVALSAHGACTAYAHSASGASAHAASGAFLAYLSLYRSIVMFIAKGRKQLRRPVRVHPHIPTQDPHMLPHSSPVQTTHGPLAFMAEKGSSGGQGIGQWPVDAIPGGSGAGYGRPVDRGVWTAKTVKRPRQQPAHPQYANYWAPLTRKRHTMPHSAQPQHTNYWAPRTRKGHQQEHRPQRPTESSDPTQHAKGRTGDRPGPRKGATTRRNVTQGGLRPSILWAL